MASNPNSVRVVEKHRLAQLLLAVSVYAAIIRSFSWLTTSRKRPREDLERVIKSYNNVIRPYRKESYRLSVLYFKAYREAELNEGPGDIDFGVQYSDDILDSIDRITRNSSIPGIFRDDTDIDDAELAGVPLIDGNEIDDLFERFLADEQLDDNDLSDGEFIGEEVFVPDLPGDLSQDQVTRQILATVTDDIVEDRPESAVDKIAGQAVRNSLNSGRATVIDMASRDKRVKGYMRVSDGNPCAFCALLISRGPVYVSEESAGKLMDAELGELNRYHDNCGCKVVHVYSASNVQTTESKEIYQFYLEATKGKSGKAALRAFRKAWDARVADQANSEPVALVA